MLKCDTSTASKLLLILLCLTETMTSSLRANSLQETYHVGH